MSFGDRLIATAVVVTALAIPATSSAATGSIAFLREGNVWLAAPDGSGAHQLTTAGGYLFVSAAKGSGSPLLRSGSATSRLAAGKPATIELRLSKGALGKIKKAQKHHKKVTAEVGAVAQVPGSNKVQATKTFRVRH
jgi:hypothetical protein